MLQDKKWLGLLAGSVLTAFAAGVIAQDEAEPEEAVAEESLDEEVVAEDAAAAETADAEAAEAEEPAAAKVKPIPSELMPLAAKSMLLDIANTGERLIAVGDRGHILASINGKDWVQVVAPARSPLTGVTFVDAKTGWAVGHDAVILHTADGGRTWALQNFQPELEKPFLDVLFLDAQRGFAVGAYGLFYQTSDGGKTWSDVDSPIREDELHFNSISRLANGDLLIAGEQGTLAISGDQGASWEKLVSPYESSLFGALPVGEKGAVLFGLRGNVYFSADPRSNEWTPLETNTVASMFGGAQLASGELALVGLNGAILIVGTDGRTVRQLQTKAGTPLSGVIAAGEDTLIAVGESGPQRVQVQ